MLSCCCTLVYSCAIHVNKLRYLYIVRSTRKTVYVYIFVCIHIHLTKIYTCLRTRSYTYTFLHAQTCETLSHMLTYIRVYVHVLHAHTCEILSRGKFEVLGRTFAYIYANACMYACMHVCTREIYALIGCKDLLTHANMHARMHTHLNTYVRTCMHTHTHAHRTRSRTSIHQHTHTHTHTHRSSPHTHIHTGRIFTLIYAQVESPHSYTYRSNSQAQWL